MGFGKRGTTSPSRPGSDDDSDVDYRATRNDGSEGGVSAPVLTVVLAIFAVAIGAGAALLTGSSSSGPGPGPAVAARASGGGAHARIAAACMPPMPENALRRVGLTDDEFRYQRALVSADYFTCALSREPERFCAADEKALLVKELQAYFGHIAAKQSIYDKYAGDASAKTMMKMAAAVEGKDGGISSRARPEPDASVVERVRELVRQGFLETGDFGWSIPDEIEPHLEGVEKIKASC